MILIKRKYKIACKYLSFSLFALASVLTIRTCSAAESNFYDYVQDEERRELFEQSITSELENDASKASDRNGRLLPGHIVSVTLTLFGAFIVFYTRRIYLKPYAIDNSIVLDDKGAESFIFSMSPIEISAVLNMNVFTKYDLIATLFDLVQRKVLYIERAQHDEAETTIYLDEERFSENKEEIENYEGFLIRWLFRKVGGDGSFSADKLRQYFVLDSRAAEFDIDYDIWLDEIYEYTANMEIIDSSTEKWKVFCAVFGVIYAAIGLAVLYATNSAISPIVFSITLLSYLVSNKAVRRSKTSQAAYAAIMAFKEYMHNEIVEEEKFEDNKKWDMYFVYSIPLQCTEQLLKKYGKSEELYHLIETELDKAIIYANNIINSPIVDK